MVSAQKFSEKTLPWHYQASGRGLHLLVSKLGEQKPTAGGKGLPGRSLLPSATPASDPTGCIWEKTPEQSSHLSILF